MVVMSRSDIERLKRYVLNQYSMNKTEPLRTSAFVVACAFVWTLWTKARKFKGDQKGDNDYHYLCFVADCWNRGELAIPETYFGNCLDVCFVRMERSELVGENGIVAATKGIGNRVWEFENEVLRDAKKWFTDWKKLSAIGHLVTIAGSPKMRAYDTDFGWGKPKKTEVVHVYLGEAIHIGDCKNDGGIEIGLAVNRDEMEAFKDLFEHGLRMMSLFYA